MAKFEDGELGVDVLVGRRITGANVDREKGVGVIEDETGATYRITGPLVQERQAKGPQASGPPSYVNQKIKGHSSYTVMLDGQRLLWWLEANAEEGWATYHKTEGKGARMVLDAAGQRRVFKSEGKVAILAAPPTVSLTPDEAMR